VRLILPALSVAVLAVGCAAPRPEADPVQLKLNDLDARITRIERIVANQVEVAQRLDEVQGAVAPAARRLRSSSTAMRRWPSQQRDLYADLDQAPGGSDGAAGPGAAAGGRRAAAPPGRLPRRAAPRPGAATGALRATTLLGRAACIRRRLMP